MSLMGTTIILFYKRYICDVCVCVCVCVCVHVCVCVWMWMWMVCSKLIITTWVHSMCVYLCIGVNMDKQMQTSCRTVKFLVDQLMHINF